MAKNLITPDDKPELRFFKVKISAELRTLIHSYISTMLFYLTRGRLKHVTGKEINFLNVGDAFIESNNGGAHYVKNVEKKQAILHMVVVSVIRVPTAINKIS